MIMKTGTIPDKDACLQCYQPPVFYWTSAVTGNAAMQIGAKLPQLPKLFQFIVCFYGILTIGIIYFILTKLPLSDFSRLLAFGTACFLPRHIYMSAINSNDTISYLFVALSIYLLLIAIERKFPFLLLVITSIVISITLFTKYTSFVVLPIVLIIFASLLHKRLFACRREILRFFILTFLIPITILSAYLISNEKKYGTPLPWNVKQLDPALTQPRDKNQMDFVSFKPWESLNTPIIVPGKMHSFWTLVYAGMYFDNEPKFLYFLDSNPAWWHHYYSWLGGAANFPIDPPPMSLLTRFSGGCLEAFGFFPLLLIVMGFYNFFIGRWRSYIDAEEMVKMNIFPTLLCSNAGGIIALAMRLPVYSAAKASYFLNSLPAFVVFLSLGLMPFEKNKTLKWIIVIPFSCLFVLASLHILHIWFSLSHLTNDSIRSILLGDP